MEALIEAITALFLLWVLAVIQALFYMVFPRAYYKSAYYKKYEQDRRRADRR